MKKKNKYVKQIITLSMAALLVTGCGKKSSEAPASESAQVMEQGAIKSFRPAPHNLLLQEDNHYPYLGLSFGASDRFMEMVNKNEVYVNAEGSYNEKNQLEYGYFYFHSVPEDEKAKIPGSGRPEAILDYSEFEDWLKQSTTPLLRISVFQKEYLDGKDLAELTGMPNNELLGENEQYRFYYSTTDAQERKEELDYIISSIAFEAPREMDDNYMGFTTKDRKAISDIGDFTAVDLDGNPVTKDIFKDYDLTMINVWTTWCGPCIEEMPALAELSEEMKDQRVQIIGIVYDVLDAKTGEINKERLELAKRACEKTGVNYIVLIPDQVLLDGLLQNTPGFPDTHFVDKNGTVIGESYLGSHSKEDWKELITTILGQVKEGTNEN